MKDLNESELMGIVFRGEKKTDRAFAELYSRNAKTVYSFCRCMLNDKSKTEDIFQETFIRFFKSCKSGTPIQNVRAFLITIARNLVKNTYSSSPEISSYLVNAPEPADESSSYEDAELMNMIMTSLDLMDEKYKETFIYREFYNMTFDEISNITGVSVNGVKSRLLRAKLKLAEILQPYVNENY